MKKSAFTLIEILIAMTIIGIIATATATSIKNISYNKDKLAFQNGYNHIVQTVAAMASDETLYPNVPTGALDTTGHPIRQSMCEMGYPFADFFVKEHSKFTKIINYAGLEPHMNLGFETAGGASWFVFKNPRNNYCEGPAPEQIRQSEEADYFVMFDINGAYEGPNCPFNIQQPLGKGNACKYPDTFKFAIDRFNNVLFDNYGNYYRDTVMSEYIKKENFLQTK